MLSEMASLDAGPAPKGMAAARGGCFGWLAPVVSFALHAGLAAAVALHAPSPPAAEMTRGGAALDIEMAVVGDQDQVATESGAMAEPPPLPREAIPHAAIPREVLPPALATAPPAETAPAPQVLLPPVAEPLPEVTPQPLPAVVPLRSLAPRHGSEKKPPRQQKRVERQVAHHGARVHQAETRGGSGGITASAGAGTMASYRARVIAHLTRYKNYPEQAQEQGITGRNSVTITLTREGRALATAISGSAHAMLDAASLAAVRRAQPFPPMPAGGPATLTLTIGLTYRLH